MITNAKNPKWTDSEHTSISLEVLVDGEWVPFTAAPNDCEFYGQMLYNFAVNGVFGEIAEHNESQEE